MKKLIAALLVASSLGCIATADVVREGTGARRTALNAMELKPFPAEAWGKLSEWTSGTPIASADTSGQVVLICTWAGWYQPSTRALALATRLAKEKAKDGLVVVAAHNPEGWAEAEKPAVPEGAKMFIAHDAKGEFRKMLMVDQDPDFYVIDRAGQMRFADIDTGSVEAAVKSLLEESAEKAAGINASLAAAKTKQEEDFRRTGDIRQEVDIRSLPEVPFTDPTPEAYSSASWPRAPKRDGYDTSTGGNITLPEEGFFPAKPKTKGRVLIVYVFSPYVRFTFDEILPSMDQLQRQMGRDVAVVGSVVPIRPDNQQSNQEDQDPTRVTKMAEQFVAARRLDHAIIADGGSSAGFSGSSVSSLPYVAIASSDGVVRWSGDPRTPAFRAAVDQVLRSDPGVKARRAAEEKYIKTKK